MVNALQAEFLGGFLSELPTRAEVREEIRTQIRLALARSNSKKRFGWYSVRKHWAYWNIGAKMYAVFPAVVGDAGSPSNISIYKSARKKAPNPFGYFRVKIWKLSQSAKYRLHNWRNPIRVKEKV